MKKKFKLEKLTEPLRYKLEHIQKLRCYYCNTKMELNGKRQITREHLTKRADGGNNDIDNVVFACELCNSNRGDYTPEQWKKHHKNIFQIRNLKYKVTAWFFNLYAKCILDKTPSKNERFKLLVKRGRLEQRFIKKPFRFIETCYNKFWGL